ncbi:MAG: flagellar hook-length control protein FliK [Lachnospiraceae bacterium]|nr:flagellar hook-length control protein FliK [Lachnospiraceae bacterium]
MLVQNSRENVDLSGIFSVSKGFLNGKVSEKENDSFGSMLKTLTSISQISSGNVKTRADELATATVAENGNSQSKVGTVYEKTAEGNQDVRAEEKAETNESAKTEEPKDTEKASEDSEETKAVKTEENEKTDESAVEALSCLFVQITTVVTETLDITADELKSALDAMGIELRDLQDFGNLKELFSFVKCDGDVTKLLTDNNLLSELNALSDKLSEAFSELAPDQLEMMDFEDIQKFVLDKLGVNKEENVEETVKNVSEENETEIHVAEATSGDEKTVTIEFKKESGAGTHTGTKQERKSAAGDNESLKESFIGNLVKANDNMGIKFDAQVVPVHDVREIANQILTQIKVNLKPEMKMLEMQLTPESLGKVKVQLSEANGVLTAKFTTESDIAKEAIESNLIHFKETLTEQGLKVDSVEVTVGNFSFDKNDSGNNSEAREGKSHKKGFVISEDTTEIKDIPDLLAQSYIEDGTSTVSYRA